MLSLAPAVSCQINSFCAAWLPRRVFMCISSILTPRRSSGVRLHIISFMPLNWPWTLFIKVSSMVQILLHIRNNCILTVTTLTILICSLFLLLSFSLCQSNHHMIRFNTETYLFPIVPAFTGGSRNIWWDWQLLEKITNQSLFRWCSAFAIHVQWWKKATSCMKLGSSKQNIIIHSERHTDTLHCM